MQLLQLLENCVRCGSDRNSPEVEQDGLYFFHFLELERRELRLYLCPNRSESSLLLLLLLLGCPARV